MSWIIWIAGVILAVTTFEPGTLAFYVVVGLVFLVGSTFTGGHASAARADLPAAKN